MLSLTFYPQLCARKLFHIQCFEEPCSVKLLESQVDFTVNIRFVAFFYHTFFFFFNFSKNKATSPYYSGHILLNFKEVSRFFHCPGISLS